MYMFDFARLRSYHKEEFEVLIALLQKLGKKVGVKHTLAAGEGRAAA